MNICEKKGALSFDEYRRFVEMVKASDAKVYDYLGELGILVDDKKVYEDNVSKVKHPDGYERCDWEKIAKVFRLYHMSAIDTLYSEMRFLSGRTVKEGTILFGGCGNGDIMEWIKRNTKARVVGLDFANNMLNEYKGRCKADIVLGNCKNIPLQDCSVDQVILCGILPSKDIEVIKESKRVVIPGGEVLADMFNYKLLTLNHDDYAGTTKDFMNDRNFKNAQNIIFDDTENLDCTNDGVRNLLCEFIDVGLYPRYEFSSSPLIPRAHGIFYEVEIPVAVIGKKPLSKSLN